MTIRELRIALINIENQEMTVRELRRRLFDEENQEVSINVAMIKMNKEFKNGQK